MLLAPPPGGSIRKRTKTGYRYWSRSQALRYIDEFDGPHVFKTPGQGQTLTIRGLAELMRRLGYREFILYEDGYPHIRYPQG